MSPMPFLSCNGLLQSDTGALCVSADFSEFFSAEFSSIASTKLVDIMSELKSMFHDSTPPTLRGHDITKYEDLWAASALEGEAGTSQVVEGLGVVEGMKALPNTTGTSGAAGSSSVKHCRRVGLDPLLGYLSKIAVLDFAGDAEAVISGTEVEEVKDDELTDHLPLMCASAGTALAKCLTFEQQLMMGWKEKWDEVGVQQ